MLKVLYLPIGKQPGTEDAFREVGVKLSVFDFCAVGKTEANSTFLNMVKENKPDLVHMQLQMTNIINPEVIQNARKSSPNTIFTNWTGDIRKQPSSYFISISKVVDYSLLSHIGQINLYKQYGCKNPRYWQIGYDPKVYFPQKKQQFKYNVSFAANSYARNLFPDSHLRNSIAIRLKNEFSERFGLFGSGYSAGWNIKSVDIAETNNIYNDSACVLSVSHFNDVSHYFSDRLLMCLASGRPTIVYRFPGIQSYFSDRSELLVAKSIDHVVELVKFCISHKDEVTNIGRNGFRKVNSEHTFASRIIELLTMTNLIQKV